MNETLIRLTEIREGVKQIIEATQAKISAVEADLNRAQESINRIDSSIAIIRRYAGMLEKSIIDEVTIEEKHIDEQLKEQAKGDN